MFHFVTPPECATTAPHSLVRPARLLAGLNTAQFLVGDGVRKHGFCACRLFCWVVYKNTIAFLSVDGERNGDIAATARLRRLRRVGNPLEKSVPAAMARLRQCRL
jgi:hypothetical protein